MQKKLPDRWQRRENYFLNNEILAHSPSENQSKWKSAEGKMGNDLMERG